MEKENSPHLTTAAQILVVLTPFKGQRGTNLHRVLSAGQGLAPALDVMSHCVGVLIALQKPAEVCISR